jgi:DNA-binding PadR family transcriptional regulator
MEVLILSSLARKPMHGYELKLEFRYKHVRWWAKCEHGHLYAALTRLEQRGYIGGVDRRENKRNRKVYAITAKGRKRVRESIEAIGRGLDATYFDIDIFLASAFVIGKEQALEVLRLRREWLRQRLVEARKLCRRMQPHVPVTGILIMEHRVDHLQREVRFTDKAIKAISDTEDLGPFLGKQPIDHFVQERGVPLEENDRS